MTTIPSHHNVGDVGHASDHNAMADALTAHDQSISNLQSVTSGIFYVAGGNVSNITGTNTSWATVNLPTGDRSAAADTFAIFHGSNKIFWFDGYGHPRTKNDDPTHVPSVIDAVSGQTANLVEWRVNGTAKASIAADGSIKAPNITPGVWTDLTLSTGIIWYQHGTHKPQYRIVNDEVQLRGGVSKSNGTDFTSSPVTIGTLPTGARPTAFVYGIVARQLIGSTLAARLQVDSSGAINIYIDTANSAAWIALDNTRYSILGD